jgi:hypothetical protein
MNSQFDLCPCSGRGWWRTETQPERYECKPRLRLFQAWVCQCPLRIARHRNTRSTCRLLLTMSTDRRKDDSAYQPLQPMLGLSGRAICQAPAPDRQKRRSAVATDADRARGCGRKAVTDGSYWQAPAQTLAHRVGLFRSTAGAVCRGVGVAARSGQASALRSSAPCARRCSARRGTPQHSTREREAVALIGGAPHTVCCLRPSAVQAAR